MLRVGYVLVLSGVLVAGTAGEVRAQTAERAKLAGKIESLGKQLRELESEYLKPSAADLKTHSSYLNTPGRGVIRLLPRPSSERNSVVMIRGGGAYYSFTRLTHEYGYGSDISLEDRGFSVGFAGADFGVIADIGDTPLDQVSESSPGVRFLATWPTPSRLSEARIRQRLCGEGFIENGIAYKSRIGSAVGRTYVVRSVSYDRSDSLVAFHVARRDMDGSLILIWRMIKELPGPTLVRDKVE